MQRPRWITLDSPPVARRIVAALTLVMLVGVLLPAAHPSHAQVGDITVTVDEVDASSFPTVEIQVSVRDQTGVPIPDLTADHFEIIEDGAVAYAPTAVDAHTNLDADVSLAIVIDLFRTLSGAPMEAAQEATEVLLNDLFDDPDGANRAAFVGIRQGLSTDPADLDEDYDVPFTSDRNRLLNVISFLHERIQETGPGTPLYDAVIKAIRMAEATEPVAQRAVIVMTDGMDRTSVSTDSDTIQRAVGARTPVFTVGLSNAGLDEQYLRRLAENTGGVYQAAQTAEDFTPLFTNVLTMLRQQYVLRYDSSAPGEAPPQSVMVRVRTPAQLEGFQEYRVYLPAATADEGDQEPAPPPEDVEADPEAQIEPVVADDGVEADEEWLTTATDWILDNLLQVILIVGALFLFILAVVIVLLLVIRRRRGRLDDGASPLEPPPYPSDPGWTGEPGGEAGDVWRGGTEQPDDFGLETEGPGVPPPATVMDNEINFGPRPGMRHEGRPSEPPGAPQPGLQPSDADRTRILARRPKMSQVGLLIDRDHPEQRYDVAMPVVTIGRAEQSDIAIDDGTVSRQHAVIKLEDGQFQVYDVGSTNGTFVGETRVREPMTLEDGVIVRFGERSFIFKIVSLE